MVHVRRLVKAGNVSHTVSLPVKWLDKNNLKRGDIVYIKENKNNELTISPQLVSEEIQQKEKIIELENKTTAEVAREITSSYINNYTHVTLIGNVELHKEKLRELMSNFSAFEITDQTDKRIVLRDLLNIKEVSVDSTINRMDMILRSMFQDVINGLETDTWDETIKNRDADMDKFYFLIYRLVKMVLKDTAIANSINISSEKAFNLWILTHTLEEMGDHCKNLYNQLQNIPKSNINEFKTFLKELQSLYLESIKAYNLKDITLSHKVADERPKMAKKLSEMIAKTHKTSSIEALKSMESIINSIGNLTRLTFDTFNTTSQ